VDEKGHDIESLDFWITDLRQRIRDKYPLNGQSVKAIPGTGRKDSMGGS